MTRDETGAVRARDDAGFSAVDRAMLEHIEGLYGPMKQAESDVASSAGGGALARRRPGTPGSVMRTLLFVSAAFLAWYALAGGEASVQRTVDLIVARVGPAATAEPTPEYVLATRTLGVDRLAASDSLILQFKELLDVLAPKCVESRAQLATVTIDRHAAKQRGGVETPMLTLLVQLDTSLSEQTRATWPTSCANVMARL